jgi:transcriptional regulator with XRE-family HTH domain
MIGEKLRGLRNRQGMTQKELAGKLKMDQSVLSRYERGELRLHGSLLASIAKILKASVDEIVSAEEIKHDRVTTDRRFVRRLQLIDSLPKRKKHALLTTLDEFLKGAGATAE